MKTREPFQLADTELRPGVTLIEASAGTGKTFAIAGIALRLVLEQRIGIEQILAVTYTVAATGELRDRIRRRLRSALDDLRRRESQDEIVNRFLRDGDVGQGIRDLDLAVQNFDEAQIFTIHGFCQRVLREHAFESGALFDTELLADPAPIFDEVARDFWRRRFYEAPPLLPRLALMRGESPENWTKLLNRLRNHPGIRILPEAGDADCAGIGGQLEKKLGEVLAQWKCSATEVETILAGEKNLGHAEKTFRRDKVDEIARSFTLLAENFDGAPFESLDALKKTRSSSVVAATKKNKTPPGHRMFDLCEEFCVLEDRFFNRLTHEFIAYARREMAVRKARRNVATYDDLLTRLHDALSGGEGAALAAALGKKYRAALIDEFQDTDPVQYEIFRRIFDGGEHRLFFIGDPKQAIYGFRGADVFTYLAAVKKAARRFTLGTNWRSEKPLLAAFNEFFKAHPSFGDGIEYREVCPPPKPREGFAELVEKNAAGHLRFRFLPGDPGRRGFAQGDAEPLITSAVVADIARLKNGGARLGGRSLKFNDVAVLARTNAQAAKLQDALRANGIKSVLKSDESVFVTWEARELLRILQGVAEPGRGGLLKAALATSLFGRGAAEIAALDADERQWEEWVGKFQSYRSLWKHGGFMAMFRRMLAEQHARERLVQRPGGERTLTNFLHLCELLHEAEAGRRLAPESLCAWFRKQRNDSKKGVEKNQLRLESDDDAALIATVHKSKGLEYPVVFCPFLWKPAVGSGTELELLFHDPKKDHTLTFDLRGENEAGDHARLTRAELLSESLRLLYVAMTRAQNRCYVYAGDIRKSDSSPLACLLGGKLKIDTLESLAQKSGGTIAVSAINPDADRAVKVAPVADTGAQPFFARPFNGSVSQVRMITSFSGLTSDSAKEEPDRDVLESGDAETAPESGDNDLAGFERGVRAGLFLHDVLEHLDFKEPARIDELVRQKLASHGISDASRAALSARLRRLLDVPLKPGLTLGRVALTDRLSEVEFSHPIALLHPEQIREVFAKHGNGKSSADFCGSLGRLNFRPVEGFMRGFIDLLFCFEERFYIVDWKSNWLGNRPGDYDETGVRASMAQHSYFLQYQLYTVAADLFLSRRIPGYDYEKHFGGVFYIFLRGVDPAMPERGIFRDRPSAALVRDLRDTLTGERP